MVKFLTSSTSSFQLGKRDGTTPIGKNQGCHETH
jgi:hypothetical protein